MGLKIFIIAGESSGDHLGASLMRSLKKLDSQIEFRGIGGPEMLSSGLSSSLFPMDNLSVMGLVEVLPKIPKFISLIHKTVQAIKVFNPDYVITIDSPDFCFRVQEKISDANIKAKKIHYVAPSVWAWRPERAEKIARFLDGMICLFPFEPMYFEREGLKSIAVGHPMMKSGVLQGDGARFRAKHNIPADKTILGIFCGSRRMELEQSIPVMRDVIAQLKAKNHDFVCVIPTLENWKEDVEEHMAGCGVPTIVTAEPADKWDAFSCPNIAVAVSGTVALEIALASVPHVIMYRMNAFTWQIVRRLVKTRFAHLGNILLGHQVYPEFIQDDAEPEKIADALEKLLSSESERMIQIEAQKKIVAQLEPNPHEEAADTAAQFIYSFSEVERQFKNHE